MSENPPVAAPDYLAAIVESSGDAILAKNLDGIIQFCNPAAERLFGYTAAELIGQPVRILIPPERQREEGEILTRIGANHVIYPEADAGVRAAHLVSGRMLDFIEFDDDFAIVKMYPPKETQGFTLAESQVRSKYGVTIVGVKSPGEDFTYAQPHTKVSSRDMLIVSGHVDLLERFARNGATHVYTLVSVHDQVLAPFFRQVGFRDAPLQCLGRTL